VRADLLAVAEQDVEDGLSGCPLRAPISRSPFWGNRVCAAALGTPSGQAPGDSVNTTPLIGAIDEDGVAAPAITYR
jgi:hypothetical protein